MDKTASFTVGIVGATGAVGQELLRLLEGRAFPLAALRLFASARSAAQDRAVRRPFLRRRGGEARRVCRRRHSVLRCGGLGISRACARRRQGWLPGDRQELGIPARSRRSARDPGDQSGGARAPQGDHCQPELLDRGRTNGLWPLHRRFGLRQYIVATYQSVSGAGAAAVRELEAQVVAHTRGTALSHDVLPHQIAFNVFPQVDAFGPDGYTGEETKMMLESRKIMGLPQLLVSATCVRVPVVRAHSAAINAAFERPVSVEEAREAVAAFPGAELVDDPSRRSTRRRSISATPRSAEWVGSASTRRSPTAWRSG